MLFKRLSLPSRFDRAPVVRGLGRASVLAAKPKSKLAAGDGTDPAVTDPETGDPPTEDLPVEAPDAEGDQLAQVDPTGGKYGAGIIRRMSVMSRGEALGHGFWIDATAIQQTADAINTAGLGIKSRFTHPNLSGDGFGKLLGRCFDAVVEGDRVLADLHFLESSHDTPDGDLAGYVMKLAQEDPAAFGASIAFEHDEQAENVFFSENQEIVQGTDSRGNPKEISRFKSPDPENVNGYWHMRLGELRAVDVVDEPAANPQGLFHRETELLREGEAVLDFVLGLSDKPPVSAALSFGGIAPERLKGFLGRYSATKGIAVSVSKLAADPREELKKYVGKFGAEMGAAMFAEGVPWEAALEKRLASVEDDNKKLRERLAAVKLGEEKPLGFSHPPKKPEGDGAGSASPSTKTGGVFNSGNVDKFAATLRIPGEKASNN